MSAFIKCPHCPCLFCTESDLKKHMGVMPLKPEDHRKKFQYIHKSIEYGGNGDEPTGWRKSKYGDGLWCFASDMPDITSACVANGKLMSGGYETTLDPTGKYLRKKFARV